MLGTSMPLVMAFAKAHDMSPLTLGLTLSHWANSAAMKPGTPRPQAPKGCADKPCRRNRTASAFVGYTSMSPTVFITDCSYGICRMARRFARAGARVGLIPATAAHSTLSARTSNRARQDTAPVHALHGT